MEMEMDKLRVEKVKVVRVVEDHALRTKTAKSINIQNIKSTKEAQVRAKNITIRSIEVTEDITTLQIVIDQVPMEIAVIENETKMLMMTMMMLRLMIRKIVTTS